MWFTIILLTEAVNPLMETQYNYKKQVPLYIKHSCSTLQSGCSKCSWTVNGVNKNCLES